MANTLTIGMETDLDLVAIDRWDDMVATAAAVWVEAAESDAKNPTDEIDLAFGDHGQHFVNVASELFDHEVADAYFEVTEDDVLGIDAKQTFLDEVAEATMEIAAVRVGTEDLEAALKEFDDDGEDW